MSGRSSRLMCLVSSRRYWTRPDLDAWTLDDENEFFRRIGIKLEAWHFAGKYARYSRAIYEIAEELVGGAGEEADLLADDLWHVSHNGLVGGGIWDRLKDRLIWMSWTEGRTGSASGVEILDFGTGNLFVMEPPDEDQGTDWELIEIIDPSDRERMVSIAYEFVSRGSLPDNLYLSEYLSRGDIEQAYSAVLESGIPNDWTILQSLMANREGASRPIETASQKEELLEAWLDRVIRRG